MKFLVEARVEELELLIDSPLIKEHVFNATGIPLATSRSAYNAFV